VSATDCYCGGMIWQWPLPAPKAYGSSGSIRQLHRPRDIIYMMVYPSSIDHLSAFPFRADAFIYRAHAFRSGIESVIGPRCRA
jgi:hypothetical protein